MNKVTLSKGFPMFRFDQIKSAFTLAEAMVSLTLAGILIAVSLPMILSSVQNSSESAKGAKIKRMQTELANAMSTYKRTNDVNLATNVNVLENMTYSRRYTSGAVTLDAPPRNEANATGVTLNFNLSVVGNNAYTMPFGGTLIAFPQDFSSAAFTTCTNPEQRAMRFLYDPDSTSSNDNDSVFLYLYEDERVRSLGTLIPNTCTQTAIAQVRVLGADPRGFRD
jgi:type II secretory pathway pseudopilin PulG